MRINSAILMFMPSSLLKFQIGPVQDFIAQARSTRDLWSGSYLLSWLVAAGIRKLKTEGGSLIFPNDADKCQPLLELPESAEAKDHSNLSPRICLTSSSPRSVERSPNA